MSRFGVRRWEMHLDHDVIDGTNRDCSNHQRRKLVKGLAYLNPLHGGVDAPVGRSSWHHPGWDTR